MTALITTTSINDELRELINSARTTYLLNACNNIVTVF